MFNLLNPETKAYDSTKSFFCSDNKDSLIVNKISFLYIFTIRQSQAFHASFDTPLISYSVALEYHKDTKERRLRR